ncbi:LysR family transcriptional regulator [Salirhabdus salicampi]|uniref:LysR family transcriptional regulator n=1 Tax=Salirhabdus salicampi TaxID=476102 RepID=UPI0020C28C28|nr:LysR family transcriptional regulator [Salirhabdus salicampi]MCP8615664.1 LysR family transcriptional regulator [Salirhabdus salicampi]
MDLKDWFMIKTIYDARNITRAADQLHISQPALTYRLKQIETELSIKIFSRSRRGIIFTPEGEYLVEYATSMMTQYRQFKDRLMDMKGSVHGELRIGISSNYAHYKLPPILKEFLDMYPNIQTKVNTGWSASILKSFLNEEIQIGIVRGEYDHDWDGPKILMNEDPMCLISKKPLHFNNLPNLPQISYKTDQNLKHLIDKWWKNNFNRPPHIMMEVDKLETCKELIKQGLGYAVIPRYLLQNEEETLFVQNLRTPEGELIYRKLWLFYREKEMNLSVVKSFVDFIQAKLKEQHL